MNFKKLALASVIATMPMSAFALDEITDEALSDVSGQDGISATLSVAAAGIKTDIFIHDKDGLNGAFLAAFTGSSAYSFDGAIIINDMQIGGGAINSIVISIDAGSSAVSGAGNTILNVNVALPAALTILTGAIQVANSQRDDGTPAWSVDAMSATILNSMTIVLGGTQLNIQLGNEVQAGSMAGTDMMVISASVASGIVLSGFRLNDATGGLGDGGLGNTTMTILDTGSNTTLTLGVDINVIDQGLLIGLGQVGTAAGGMDIRIVDQYLGTTTNSKIGDISIVGLNLNGSTLLINGK